MEKNLKNEQAIIPTFFKMNKIKLGGEENDKIFIAPNSEKNKDTNDNVKNTTEKVKFLFPDLSPNDIKNVLERAEYNIEKTIDLIRELKQEQKKNSGENNSSIKINKRVKKRNYLEFIKSINEFEDKKNNINKNINNTIPNNKSLNKEKEDPKTQSTEGTNENNENTDISNIIINNLDEDRKNLINQQINYLLNKFDKMNDISELKKVLTEFGFPTTKEEIENSKINNEELRKKLDEKVKANREQKNTIIKLYEQYTKTCDDIQKNEKLKEELSNTYINLLETETDQKIRKEYYENEFKAYENSLNNNYLNGPKEGC